MAIEKDLDYRARTWPVAHDILRKHGIVDVGTGGGDEWNESVRQRLSEEFGGEVVLLGPSPFSSTSSKYYRYTVQLNTNRDASVLLSTSQED